MEQHGSLTTYHTFLLSLSHTHTPGKKNFLKSNNNSYLCTTEVMTDDLLENFSLRLAFIYPVPLPLFTDLGKNNVILSFL